jgi:hypothetical protein
MARRRNNRKTFERATEIGIGMAVLVTVLARFGLEMARDESIRAGILAGGMAFGFWLVLPLVEWLWQRGSRLHRQNQRWWARRKSGVLLGLAAAILVAGVLFFVGGRPGGASLLAGVVAGVLLFALWLVRPLFLALALLARRLFDWLAARRGAGTTVLLRPPAQRPGNGAIKEHTLQRLSPRAFEELCASIARSWGYQARATGKSGDGGVDVEMWRDGEYVVAQCKHYYNRTVPIGHVRDFYGAMIHVGAARGYFFTTGRFSDGAYEFIRGKPLELVDFEYLDNILARAGRR